MGTGGDGAAGQEGRAETAAGGQDRVKSSCWPRGEGVSMVQSGTPGCDDDDDDDALLSPAPEEHRSLPTMI